MGKFILKIAIFGDFGGRIFKATMLKVGMTVWTLDSLPTPNFVKKSLKGIYPSEPKCIPKISNFGVFGAVSLHFHLFTVSYSNIQQLLS